MEIILKMFVFSAIFVVIWIISGIVEKENNKELVKNVNNEHIIIKSPKVYRWVGFLDIIFFALCLCCMGFFPNKSVNIWTISGFSIFLLLGCAIVFQTVSWRIDVFKGKNYFNYRTFFFRKYVISFEDCIDYKIHPKASTLELKVLCAKNKTKKFYIDTHAINFDSFLETLRCHKVKNVSK